jgi:hypothetical protein
VKSACLASESTKNCSLLVPPQSGHPVLLQCLSLPHWMLEELSVLGLGIYKKKRKTHDILFIF